MIDLFNSQYKEEIDFIKDNVEIQLNLPNKFLIVAMYDYGYVYLKDEFGVSWAYSKHPWKISTPDFISKDLTIGKHIINNRTYIRVADLHTIMKKIEEYLSPYLLNHIWIKDVYDINLN